MAIESKSEREFEKRHIESKRDRYLPTNAVDRYKQDLGYREKIDIIKTFLESVNAKAYNGYVLDLGANTCGESEVLFHLGYNMIPCLSG